MLNHIDLFSGAGGICTGFRAAGIETVLAVEKIASCVETYKANHPNVPVIQRDIRKVKDSEVRKMVRGGIHVVTAGMPCETFSTAGSKSRSFYDSRQLLFMEAIRIAKAIDAKLLLFENVPAITTKKVSKNGDRLIIDELYDQLSASGYKYYVDTILNAADFGIPQLRERFFVLATNDKNLGSRLRVPVSHRNGKICVRDAFAGLPHLDANSSTEVNAYLNDETAYSRLLKDVDFWGLEGHGLSYHIAPKHRPGTLKRFALLRPGEGLKDLFEKFTTDKVRSLQRDGVLPRKWYIQRNRRLVPNAPSVTVTSHCLDELVHPSQNRALTVREVARLQSFPDSYDFKGGPLLCPHFYETQDKYEQVGDAVPPLLAYAWGLTFRTILGSP